MLGELQATNKSAIMFALNKYILFHITLLSTWDKMYWYHDEYVLQTWEYM